MHWIVAAGLVAGAASVVPGFHIEGVSALTGTALVIGAANVAVLPTVESLPFPVPLIALALFYFVLNGLLMKAASWAMPAAVTTSAGALAVAALLVTIGSMLLFAMAGRGQKTREG